MNIKNIKLKKKHILISCSIIAIVVISIITVLSIQKRNNKDSNEVSTSAQFDTYIDNTFNKLVTSDALTLNFTLNNPEAYNIKDFPTTFGKIPLNKDDTYYKDIKKMLNKLEKFNYKQLDTKRQYVYDTLYWYLDTEYNSRKYLYHDEYLSPSSGVQVQIPILLSEYSFNTKEDINNYLKLLPDITRYFDDICEFEKIKAENGLFMSKNSSKKVLNQCKNIMINISTSLFITEFNNKVEKVDNITQNEIYEYEKKNEDIVLSKVLNAYTNIYTTIKTLRKTSSTDGIMYSLPNGKEYYEAYIQEITGSNRTMKNIISILENTITKENNALLSFINKNSNENVSVLNKDYGSNDGTDIIKSINKQMKKDFPTIKDITYTIKDVPSQLEDSIGPAFYVISPIDSKNNHTIYINKGAKYINTPLFTSLAHEAFPGHLYQNCYFNTYNTYPIRGLIKNLGYLEGWASYATLISYDYSNLDKYYSNLYKYNNAIVLCLSARADLGVHYEGWNIKDISDYFNQHNCPLDSDAIKQLYEMIIDEPGDYLPYSVGYIEINRMLEESKEKHGDEFNLKDFHTAILQAGPAPFSSIKSHIKY